MSALDNARAAYNKAFSELINQMRGRIRKRPDAGTEDMENLVKYLPEEFEKWVEKTPNLSYNVFDESRWAEYCIIQWGNDKNKARKFITTYWAVKKFEKEMLAAWKS